MKYPGFLLLLALSPSCISVSEMADISQQAQLDLLHRIEGDWAFRVNYVIRNPDTSDLLQYWVDELVGQLREPMHEAQVTEQFRAELEALLSLNNNYQEWKSLRATLVADGITGDKWIGDLVKWSRLPIGEQKANQPAHLGAIMDLVQSRAAARGRCSITATPQDDGLNVVCRGTHIDRSDEEGKFPAGFEISFDGWVPRLPVASAILGVSATFSLRHELPASTERNTPDLVLKLIPAPTRGAYEWIGVVQHDGLVVAEALVYRPFGWERHSGAQ